MSYSVEITRRAGDLPVLPWSTFWDEGAALGDWRVAPLSSARNAGGLDESEPLTTAVLLSLFTDRRAPEGWRPEVADRRGWWGDGVAPAGESLREDGSWLWTLRNESATPENALLARAYAEEALAWIIEERVAAQLIVSSGLIERPRRGIWLGIEIYGREGALVFDRRFARIWDGLK